MQELLYCNRRSEDPADNPTHGHVSLVFQKRCGTTVKFTRAITVSGSDSATFSSRYSIDTQTVSADAFMQELLSVGINTRARNFLVFQVCCKGLHVKSSSQASIAAGSRCGTPFTLPHLASLCSISASDPSRLSYYLFMPICVAASAQIPRLD